MGWPMRAPDVPDQIVVLSETNKVSFHALWAGFQVYTHYQ
jgi:hypothetical protein